MLLLLLTLPSSTECLVEQWFLDNEDKLSERAGEGLVGALIVSFGRDTVISGADKTKNLPSHEKRTSGRYP